MITQKLLHELFDLRNGEFFRKKSVGGRYGAVGMKAGSPRKDGYIQAKIGGKHYLLHRLVWLYVHGVMPDGEVDHIDHNKTNNSIENLRCIGKSGNQQNRISARSDNKSTGMLGVQKIKASGKYRARIHVDGKEKHIGVFDNPQDAYEAYLDAKRIYHSTCTL